MSTKSSFTWLFVVLGLWLVKLVVNQPVNDCILGADVEKYRKQSWVLGEAAPFSPFTFQFYSVYSYASTAHILSNSGLVLGPVFATRINEKEAKPVSFDLIFDILHYIKYWTRHQVPIITHPEYEKCFPDYKTIVLNRIPEFLSNNRSAIYQMFRVNNVSFPLQSNTLYRLNAQYKFAGLFDFWYDRTLFKHTYASLRPSPAIERAARYIVKLLPKPFFTIHVRFDEKAFKTINTKTGSNEEKIAEILNYIDSSSCFPNNVHKSDKNSSSNTNVLLAQLKLNMDIMPKKNRDAFPVVYLISNTRAMTPVELERERIFIQQLKKEFNVKDILTSRILFEKSASAIPLRSVPVTVGFDGAAEIFTYEQLSYVDLLVSRHSECVVPSQQPSAQSYLMKRLHTLHKTKETYAQADETRYGNMMLYKDWGI